MKVRLWPCREGSLSRRAPPLSPYGAWTMQHLSLKVLLCQTQRRHSKNGSLNWKPSRDPFLKPLTVQTRKLRFRGSRSQQVSSKAGPGARTLGCREGLSLLQQTGYRNNLCSCPSSPVACPSLPSVSSFVEAT